MSARTVVMISSTVRDLPDHRREIREGCERAGFEPRMMEKDPALDADPIKASLRMVDEADAYIGVFAFRYGYVPEGNDVSITEMEYNRAVELQKPRLVFFIHDDHPITKKDVETGQGEAKLEALKDRIGKERVVAFFRSPKDLRAQVVEALTALAKELDAAAAGGDATAAVVAKLHRNTSITTPPEPYIAHPYTLLQSRELVGRQAELNALTDWVASPASPAFAARVFCFVAIGGLGKSALTWKWFKEIAPNEMKPLVGRLWWSFYESDAGFENFLIRALCYVGGETEEAVRTLPWPEREAQLLRHLNEEPYLFVLDGLERILLAYHRRDVSYLANDEYDERTANYVAGAIGLPATAAQSFVGQHRLRQTTDPRAGAFLRKLADAEKSRILITSRLYPNALQVLTGHPRSGCFAYFLPGLSDNDALGLWRALNVGGSRAELVPIFRSVEGHPLLVQALASEVAKYRKGPGNFAQWRADQPQFDPTSLPLVQSRTHILKFALQGLSAKIREVLHTLVGFRMPSSYATLEALLVGPDKACGSAQDLDRALTELEDRGLIGWDRGANRYDAHPIVRGVVWQLTDAMDQRAVYTALEAHFEPMAAPDWENVETLADLTPAIERYHNLVGLERYDDAFVLFRDRLSDATLYRLAAHRERIAWVERLFPRGMAELPALATDWDQRYALNTLALSYRYTGRPGRAVSFFRRHTKIAARMRDYGNRGLSSEEFGQLVDEIVSALKSVYDPEIPADVYELGLIYKIDINDDRAVIAVTIDMTLTRPNCPSAQELPGMVQNAAASVPGVGPVTVNVVWDPPWKPSMISDEARTGSWAVSNLGHALCDTGSLRSALCVLRQALVLNRQTKFNEGITLENLGKVLDITGNHIAGQVACARSRYLMGPLNERKSETDSALAEHSLRLGDLVEAWKWAERAWTMAGANRNEQDFIRAALMQGMVALGLGNIARADERLHHAFTRARAVSWVELEIPALIAIAQLELAQGRSAEARARLDDVWEAAECGPYPLYQADAYNVLTDIAQVEGDKPAAIDAATKAYRAAWCDGPPYAYHWGLVTAKAHLAALGAPEPDMPPFDESKFEPMPEVEINPKDEYWVDPDSPD